jgi:hypothetical protein
MKYAALLCLAACAFAQHPPASSPLESLFRTVVQRSGTPGMQSALAFTDTEMQALNTIAADSEKRIAAIRKPFGELIFQSRLDFAETGQESETVKQQIQQMSADIAEAVAKAANQLRSALGEDRYQKFDAWLRGGGATGCWVAPCSATPRR